MPGTIVPGFFWETQERRQRRSAELYAEIAAANAIREDVVEHYAPEVMDQVFG